MCPVVVKYLLPLEKEIFRARSINHYKIPIQEEKAYVAGEMVAQERTPGCSSAKGRGLDE
jgi:hypothetical protein